MAETATLCRSISKNIARIHQDFGLLAALGNNPIDGDEISRLGGIMRKHGVHAELNDAIERAGGNLDMISAKDGIGKTFDDYL